MKSWTMGWALLLAALLLVCGWALAEEETDNLDVFNKAFMQENGLCDENGQRLYLQDMDWDGDLCYAYLTDWCVYTYTPGGEVQKLCALPEAPEGFFYDPESMSEEETEQLGGTVTYIAAWEGALYGCNVYSGRWGVIDEEGVHWEESRLNFSCLFYEDSFFPDRIVAGFMAEDALYVLADTRNEYDEYVYAVFAFDLETGASQRYDYDGLLGGVCRYTHPFEDGMMLLTQFPQGYDEEFGVVCFDFGAREFQMSSSRVTFSVENGMGGLAYDANQELTYLAANGAVYCSDHSADFEASAAVTTAGITPETRGWALPGGQYALLFDGLHIRRASEEPVRALTVSGGMSLEALELYEAEHPEVQLNTWSSMSTTTIIDYLLTGDDCVDVYALPMSYAFNLIKEKGYALSLSDSAIIEADVATMDAQVQAALRDADGRVAAYPTDDRISLTRYQIHEGYWRMLWGDRPLPTTFDELLDAWIDWEQNNLLEQYPLLGFTMDEGFNYESWVRTIIRTYIQQHDGAGEPDLSSLELRSVLEKLARLAKIRQQAGRGIKGESDGARALSSETGDAAAVFRISVQPALYQTTYQEGETVYDQDVNAFQTISLTFEAEATAYTDAEMVVFIINPYSRHREEAMEFIECMAQPEAAPLVYYAVHPDCNEPMENDNYQAQQAWNQKQLEMYTDALEKAEREGKDVTALEKKVRYYEDWQADESNRWVVSEEAIRAYRAQIEKQPLNLHTASPYLYALTEGESSFVNRLCGQYAAGRVTLDVLLQKLSARLQMITLENNETAGAG